MMITETIDEVRSERWVEPNISWGLVPTMGYLHEGHLSLVRQARSDNDRVAVSIYINPTQFAPTEDLGSYPRDIDRDIDILKNEDVDLAFIPADDVIYPVEFQSAIVVEKIARVLEGASRPGHFQGVATIVAKLLNIFQPTRVYFGQKDAQQATVIERMINDLNFPVGLVVCPTIRESDGVAMSSRNIHLTPKQRQSAPVLYKALSSAQDLFVSGERDAGILRGLLRKMVKGEPLARLDYASIADPLTLEELDWIDDRALISLAVFFGSVRLIDNVLIANDDQV
jgi:pantoate--beta-alanine ligase